jgi:hypothetical protein
MAMLNNQRVHLVFRDSPKSEPRFFFCVPSIHKVTDLQFDANGTISAGAQDPLIQVPDHGTTHHSPYLTIILWCEVINGSELEGSAKHQEIVVSQDPQPTQKRFTWWVCGALPCLYRTPTTGIGWYWFVCISYCSCLHLHTLVVPDANLQQST